MFSYVFMLIEPMMTLRSIGKYRKNDWKLYYCMPASSLYSFIQSCLPVFRTTAYTLLFKLSKYTVFPGIKGLIVAAAHSLMLFMGTPSQNQAEEYLKSLFLIPMLIYKKNFFLNNLTFVLMLFQYLFDITMPFFHLTA
jgi:hypothetical protein